MPQLAPLNWMFLFLLFWGIVFFMSVFVWWMSGKKYYVWESGKEKKVGFNKWMW